jgi:hypothetical protein
VAECRRLGIEVLPPDVHSSQLEFTVEGDAIRFGLLAVKNVGASAIESIIAARDEGGPYTSLTDFCTRIDLRLCNRKVLEALAKVGALNAFGHPRQILDGLDDAVLAAQATQRDRISGQTSLFDLGSADAASLTRPLPAAPEAPTRERLRWEKELLGLYLSEHPMGEVAAQVGQFVNAYSGDLSDESLEGQRIVVGGIVTGVRMVITKAKASMAIVTMEDLQGTIEVVVFPRLYEQTGPIWRDGSILLVAGRVDHRGEEVSILADLVAEWDDAVIKGPEAFARDVAAGDRGGRRRGPGGTGWQTAPGTGQANGNGNGPRPMVAVGPGAGSDDAGLPAAAVPVVSPLRHAPATIGPGESAAAIAPFAPVEPIPTYVDAPGMAAISPDRDLEPAVPDEARARIVADATAHAPVDAGPAAVLHVRFGTHAPSDRVVVAMETFKILLRDHPGATRVVIHVPTPSGGGALPMELRRGVAYDSELVAEVRRRLGDGLVELSLVSA